MSKTRLITVKADAELQYNWAVGRYGSRFFAALRDEKKILGIRCPKCGRVYCPPRQVCGPCFTKMDEWVELSDEGTLDAFSIVNYGFIDPNTGEPRPVPYTYAYVKLDGADVTLTHIVDEQDPARLQLGVRVKAVFREDRTGTIQDIDHFEVIG
ncbi:MAG: Zn-ribbon domain-containing OB-fold protein [Chloroflexota bacterium]|nr:MAG: Zn-ribbon domain-containing OB-fold protein [Chloroflexota bacterium]